MDGTKPAIAALRPAEYDVVQDVFKSLAQADWFDRNIANEKDCAKLVLEAYSGGVHDPDELYKTCFPVARTRFSRLQ